MVEAFQSQILNELSSKNLIETIFPVIVTTAELWRLNDSITLEQVKKSDDLGEIAKKENILFLHNRPDKELQKITKQKFSELDSGCRMALDAYFRSKYNRFLDFKISVFSSRCPSTFAIINYKYFKSEIKKIIDYFKTDSYYVNRREVIKENKKNTAF